VPVPSVAHLLQARHTSESGRTWLFSSLSIPLPPITHKIEYSTLIFLATEKKPPLKGTRYVSIYHQL
jgi:hypothetical protein